VAPAAIAGRAHPANLGSTVGDDSDVVHARRTSVAEVLRSQVRWLDAEHGARVVHVGTGEDLHDASSATLPPGDAAVTGSAHIALAALSADCVPLALADPEGGLTAVVHAGWRGAARGVLEATLESLIAKGGSAARLHLHAGPAICGRCYPVGDEVISALAAVDAGAAHAATIDHEGPGRGVDLRTFLVARATARGIRPSRITISHRCTAEDPDLFSHRRDGTSSTRGRQALIVGRGGEVAQ
jgi:YfiH family protein